MDARDQGQGGQVPPGGHSRVTAQPPQEPLSLSPLLSRSSQTLPQIKGCQERPGCLSRAGNCHSKAGSVTPPPPSSLRNRNREPHSSAAAAPLPCAPGKSKSVRVLFILQGHLRLCGATCGSAGPPETRRGHLRLRAHLPALLRGERLPKNIWGKGGFGGGFPKNSKSTKIWGEEGYREGFPKTSKSGGMGGLGRDSPKTPRAGRKGNLGRDSPKTPKAPKSEGKDLGRDSPKNNKSWGKGKI